MDTNVADETTNVPDAERTPYHIHTLNRRAAIRDEQDMFERVSNTLSHMKGLGLDLPILLHALSWENKLLTADGEARYHRSVLMNSLELPGIVQQWNKRSGAARSSLTSWAVDHTAALINAEMDTAVEELRCDGDSLTEETLLSITPCSMTSLLKPAVPTLWRVLKSASRTSQQEKRNKEDSDKVCAPFQTGIIHVYDPHNRTCCSSSVSSLFRGITTRIYSTNSSRST